MSKSVLAPPDTLRFLGEILSETQRLEFAEKNNLDFSYEAVGIGRFRVNVLRQRKGVDACFRVIPEHVPTAQELGLPDAVVDLTRLGKGLVPSSPGYGGKSSPSASRPSLTHFTVLAIAKL
jgi:twitching motility protein PilT